jgi:hypothetical protein
MNVLRNLLLLTRTIANLCEAKGGNTAVLPDPSNVSAAIFQQVRIYHLIPRDFKWGYEIRVSYLDPRTIDCLTFHTSQK